MGILKTQTTQISHEGQPLSQIITDLVQNGGGSANEYAHPVTHPASMITGLQEVITPIVETIVGDTPNTAESRPALSDSKLSMSLAKSRLVSELAASMASKEAYAAYVADNSDSIKDNLFYDYAGSKNINSCMKIDDAVIDITGIVDNNTITCDIDNTVNMCGDFYCDEINNIITIDTVTEESVPATGVIYNISDSSEWTGGYNAKTMFLCKDSNGDVIYVRDLKYSYYNAPEVFHTIDPYSTVPWYNDEYMAGLDGDLLFKGGGIGIDTYYKYDFLTDAFIQLVEIPTTEYLTGSKPVINVHNRTLDFLTYKEGNSNLYLTSVSLDTFTITNTLIPGLDTANSSQIIPDNYTGHTYIEQQNGTDYRVAMRKWTGATLTTVFTDLELSGWMMQPMTSYVVVGTTMYCLYAISDNPSVKVFDLTALTVIECDIVPGDVYSTYSDRHIYSPLGASSGYVNVILAYNGGMHEFMVFADGSFSATGIPDFADINNMVPLTIAPLGYNAAALNLPYLMRYNATQYSGDGIRSAGILYFGEVINVSNKLWINSNSPALPAGNNKLTLRRSTIGMEDGKLTYVIGKSLLKDFVISELGVDAIYTEYIRYFTNSEMSFLYTIYTVNSEIKMAVSSAIGIFTYVLADTSQYFRVSDTIHNGNKIELFYNNYDSGHILHFMEIPVSFDLCRGVAPTVNILAGPYTSTLEDFTFINYYRERSTGKQGLIYKLRSTYDDKLYVLYESNIGNIDVSSATPVAVMTSPEDLSFLYDAAIYTDSDGYVDFTDNVSHGFALFGPSRHASDDLFGIGFSLNNESTTYAMLHFSNTTGYIKTKWTNGTLFIASGILDVNTDRRDVLYRVPLYKIFPNGFDPEELDANSKIIPSATFTNDISTNNIGSLAYDRITDTVFFFTTTNLTDYYMISFKSYNDLPQSMSLNSSDIVNIPGLSSASIIGVFDPVTSKPIVVSLNNSATSIIGRIYLKSIKRVSKALLGLKQLSLKLAGGINEFNNAIESFTSGSFVLERATELSALNLNSKCKLYGTKYNQSNSMLPDTIQFVADSCDNDDASAITILSNAGKVNSLFQFHKNNRSVYIAPTDARDVRITLIEDISNISNALVELKKIYGSLYLDPKVYSTTETP